MDKDINKAQNKRYPLPLPYAAIIEMDQILGDGRSAQKVASSSYTPASNGGGPFKRGPTLMGPNGEVSTGRPYVGADGRVWRDREEELEYAGLLTSSDALRRGSDDTNTSLDEYDEERRGRRAWAKFGASTAASASTSKNAAGTTQYDRFQAAEHRLRMPHSATSSSEDGDDADGDEPWSPLVETHAAQHHFPSYVFPASSKSSRASSSIPTPPAHSTSHSHGNGGRAMPLPVSVNDFGRAAGPVPHHHNVPRAKEDFLASAFAPVPPTSSNARRSDRERSSRPPTSSSAGESRMTARRSSVQAIGRNEIVVPLPSLQPSSSSGGHSRQQPSTGAAKEKSGFLGVFKKK